jgi:hypothetical protein
VTPGRQEIILGRATTPHPGSDKTTTQSGLSLDVAWPGGAVSVHYDVTIMGEPGTVLLGAFSDVTVRRALGVTVLSADLDQAALHGLLARVADLGIELVGVRRVAGPT